MRRIAVLLAGALLGLQGISAASAHADLLSMDPASGSTVTEQPARITLTFGEDVTSLGSTAVVIDPGGTEVQSAVTFVKKQVFVEVLPFSLQGEYRVNFRIHSGDGHIIEGSESFNFNGPISTPMVIAIAPTGGTEQGEISSNSGGTMVGLGLLALIVIGGIAYALSTRRQQ